MDDLGRWMRRVLDEVAPPLDARGVVESVALPKGKRWPMAVGAAAVIVLLVGGGYWFLSGDPGIGVADDTTTTTEPVEVVTTVVDAMPVVRLNPVRITCTTELPAFPCANLIDRDLTTDWQAPNGGIGSKFTIYFADPVTIGDVQLQNLVDDTRFRRNARIREVVASAGQSPVVIRFELADTNEIPNGFGTGLWNGVTSLEIEVTAAYPAQSVGDLPPFVELALAEIEVYGYRTTPVTATSAPTAVSPLTGSWYRTNPDLGNLIVQVRDLIWDGEAFYLLTRVGFGDLIVWRSADGLAWTEDSRMGTSGVTDGPWHLASLDGRLVVGGRIDLVATIWVEGEGGEWAVTSLGEGWIAALENHAGRLVAAGSIGGPDPAVAVTLPGQPAGKPPVAAVWTSSDGVSWTLVSDPGFPDGSLTIVDLATGPSGLLASVNTPYGVAIALSLDGASWSIIGAADPAAYGPGSLADSTPGYLYVFSNVALVTSLDGHAWSSVPFVMPDPGVAGQTMALLADAAMFRDHLVAIGSVFVEPGGGAFNYSLPGVWIHLGEDRWALLGSMEWFSQSGTTYRIVTAPDRLVVVGEAGSGGDWALFTFVVDQP